MKILVFNAGSSSLKFAVFDTRAKDSCLFEAEFERFDQFGSTLRFRKGGAANQFERRNETVGSIPEAIENVPRVLREFELSEFEVIGHRVAHGGKSVDQPIPIDFNLLAEIEASIPLAPLHNPANLDAIKISQKIWPNVQQVAVFDTAFHNTIPDRACTYALPQSWRDLGLRRYGFHGISHKYTALITADELGRPITDLQIITCHLGNGSSVCAINRGFSVDISMGMTPLEGLVMGTRSGDIDPGIFAFLYRELGLSSDEVERSLYAESGLKALAGTHDLREIERDAAQGIKNAQLAIDIYAYRVRKYIGAYMAAMGGLDAIAITGGIGQNSASMRRRVCDKFEFIGLHLDDDKNQNLSLSGRPAQQIQEFGSRINVVVVKADEQFMIAKEIEILFSKFQKSKALSLQHIPVSVSARHVHLTADNVRKLFGDGYKLTEMRQLAQAEGWAANETVDLIGPKGIIQNVRILGPLRASTQIEVSKTDTFSLGVEAPIRPSGRLDNTPAIRLRGPGGEIQTHGLIIAARHIHMSPRDAVRLGLQDGDYVDVRLEGERPTVFANTLVRVKEGYVTEMHIDTDEANAAGISYQTRGQLITNATREEVGIVSRKNLQLGLS